MTITALRTGLTLTAAMSAAAVSAPSASAAEHRGAVGTGGCVAWSYQDDWDWISGVEVYLDNHCGRPCGVVLRYNDGRMDVRKLDAHQKATDRDLTTSGLRSITGDSSLLDDKYFCADS